MVHDADGKYVGLKETGNPSYSIVNKAQPLPLDWRKNTMAKFTVGNNQTALVLNASSPAVQANVLCCYPARTPCPPNPSTRPRVTAAARPRRGTASPPE